MEEKIEKETNTEKLECDTKKDETDGIYRYKGYTFWTKAYVVYEHVYNFLAEIFPNSEDHIVQEINRIDMLIMTKSDEIPVEIQSTIIAGGFKDNKLPSIAHFENVIRKQIEENINIYNKCWFFFDDELFRYIINDLTDNSG